jgi:anti-sigma B factor antagonist
MKARFKRLSRHGHSRHVIDLSNIDDLDSGGLAGLISTLRAVRESGGTIHLVASSERVTHVLELTALTRLFRVHPSLQEALEVMAAAAG